MDSISQRFLQAEDDFLLALRSDQKHLSDFAERWQTLLSDWESCLHEADHDTRELISEVAGRIEELANDFYLFKSRTLSLEDDLLSSLEDVFASLTLEENAVAQLTPVPFPTSVITTSSTERDAISPAQWLLRNLHNPYPPPHVRFSKGRNANCKRVKDWFSKARQRIGWTRLLRDRFAGCRSITTDAAFRAFVRDDPANPLDGDLRTAFLAIQSHAQLVYGDRAVSPQRSRSTSPTPSLSLSSSEDTGDELFPTSPLERDLKRPSKRTLPDPPKSPPPKRKRIDSLPSISSPQTGVIPTCAETPTLRSRKRRLSETDSDYPRSKRPRGMEDSRLHAVSAPLLRSMEPTWSDLNNTFQIPNPASTSPPDPTSFYLDFFNSSCIGQSKPMPSTDVSASVDALTAFFEMPQLDFLQPSLPSFDSDWREFLNFEPDLSLFQPSPSLASSLAGTPPLVDDATLSPPSLLDSGPSSPDPFCDFLPCLSEKGTQYPIVAEPMIQGQDFLLPPGEDAGIPFANVLLTIH